MRITWAGLRRRLNWGRLGGLSVLAARTVRTRSPAVLILSLPRSGSSWVGDTLGHAADAMYLREPLTQSGLLTRGEWVFEADPSGLPSRYWETADAAFAGVPRFGAQIAPIPGQWAFGDRPRRRVVVKEVRCLTNLALVARYGPRVVFLVRHPAAVALSYRRLGWGRLEEAAEWRLHGERQARAQRLVLDGLAGQGEHRVVVYEDLCADPREEFRRLFAFAGLTWDAGVERLVEQTTSGAVGDDDRDPYGVHRSSGRMIESWRGRAEPGLIQALREGYASVDVPWYREDADW